MHLLIEDGHTVFHARDVLPRADDAHQWSQALELEAVLLTRNVKDYRLLQRAWRLWTSTWALEISHHGAAILPHGSALELRALVRDLLAQHQPFTNELFDWNREQRAWRRYPV